MAAAVLGREVVKPVVLDPHKIGLACAIRPDPVIGITRVGIVVAVIMNPT